jgi:hypothetical protein
MAIDRRRLLIEMHGAGIATPERLRAVRAMADAQIPREVMSWSAPPPVREAAGIPAISKKAGSMNQRDVHRLAQQHLALIGRDAMPIVRLPWYSGWGAAASSDWESLLGVDAESWAVTVYGPKAARIIYRRTDPAWGSLSDIVIATGQVPIGPMGDSFAIADARE